MMAIEGKMETLDSHSSIIQSYFWLMLIILIYKTNILNKHAHTHSYKLQKEREERMSFKREMVKKFQVS